MHVSSPPHAKSAVGALCALVLAFTEPCFALDTLRVDSAAGIVEITARYCPRQFNHGLGLKNHHFVVWEKGKAAGSALFTSPVPDSLLHAALVKAGAVPGNNLTRNSWDKRNDPKAPDPDLRVEGTPVLLEIVAGDTTLSAAAILRDRASQPFDLRFGGNLALIPVWRSGCIVCLQSCPGSKVGNRTYTMRDLAQDHCRFDTIGAVPLKDTQQVILRFRVQKEHQ